MTRWLMLLGIALLTAALVGGCRTSGGDGDGDGDGDADGDSDGDGDGDPGCDPGWTECDGVCVDTAADPRHCGGCGAGCADGEACVDSACQSWDCREQPCPGLSYCDLLTGDCLPGCGSDEQCGANEHCELSTHECLCDAGHHRCSGACVSDSAAATCGDRCDPCPTDPNGEAHCDGTSCQLSCDAGHHMCDGCVPDDAIETCGDRCESCPTLPGATAVCDGIACSLECEGGLYYCEGSGDCAECCEHRHCGDDQFCDGGTCRGLDGTGWCRSDGDCGTNEACDLTTLRCVDTSSNGDCTPGFCGSRGYVCVNGRCIYRPDGAHCGGGQVCANDQADGRRMGCSPITYRCASASHCTDVSTPCGPGLYCWEIWEFTRYQWVCSSATGRECSSSASCLGLECFEDECRARIPCDTTDDCRLDSDSALECIAGECQPFFNLRCAGDADCGTGPAARHCVTEIGFCARG